jgi:dephospho-CoA kinase
MLKVGLTGGVACGKSAVGRMFAARGVEVIQADAIAHELMRPGRPVYYQVVQHFGPEIVDIDGSIDRAKLAQLAFGGGRVEELNKIVHPAVIREQEERMRQFEGQHPAGIAMVEAALILEAGVKDRFDKLVVVTCSQEQKIERYLERAGGGAAAREQAQRRIAAQLSDEEKARAANYVIDNSGSLEETERQVQEVYTQLAAAAHNSAPPGVSR